MQLLAFEAHLRAARAMAAVKATAQNSATVMMFCLSVIFI
jgi:hypothetical protein